MVDNHPLVLTWKPPQAANSLPASCFYADVKVIEMAYKLSSGMLQCGEATNSNSPEPEHLVNPD